MRHLLQIAMTICVIILAISVGAQSQIQTENYFTISINGYVKMSILDSNGRSVEYMSETKTNFVTVPDRFIEGRYRIIVTGRVPSIYWINCILGIPETQEYNYGDTTIADGGVLDSLQTDTYYLIFKRSPSLVFELEKVITPSVLRQDIINIFKLNLLNDRDELPSKVV